MLSGTRSCGRAGPARLGSTARQIERQRRAEHRIGALGGAVQALRLGIFFHQRHAGGFARRVLQIAQGFRVDREEAAGRAIFRRHVGDGGAVLQRHLVEARPVEFHELADHAVLAQHLRDGQHQIGGGDAFAQFARQLEADHFGNEHGNRLAEHGRFGLDAADAPAQHRKPVDHRGVAVGSDQRVGEGVGRRSCPSCPCLCASTPSGRDIPD